MTGTRIVVTGLGAISPLGPDVATAWATVRDGGSGITKLQDPWAADLPVRIAGVVDDDAAAHLGPIASRRLDRSQQLAVLAAREAWSDADRPGVEPERLAAVIGTGVGGAQSLLTQHDQLAAFGPRRVSPYTVPRLMPNGGAAAVSMDLGARAGAHAPTSACASGAEALWLAALLLRAGSADAVVAGGTDACIAPVAIAGFARIQALSRLNDTPEQASRPFDADRDGFVMGEGAAALVLEREEDARARGARIYAVLAGAAVTADAAALTAPSVDGQVRALRAALADADLAPQDIDHINAHGTGTPQGDLVEARALAEVLPHRPAVTATKSYSGHLLGAAGALEAVLTVLTLTHGLVPAVRNLDRVADGVDLDLVRGRHRQQPVHAAVSSSFAFGGHNAIAVLTRP